MILSTLAIALAVAGTPAPQVLAHVDAVQITRADLEERLRLLRQRRIEAPAAAILDTLVNEAVLADEARRLGLDRDPAVQKNVEQERRRLAADALVATMVPEPTDAELRALYHQTGDSVRLVLVKLETEAAAREALQRVQKGGDLAAEARRSLDPALAGRGGDTGALTRASIDAALQEQVFTAPVGALVGPVQLTLGWAIARVVERHIADEAAFAERRAAIANHARDRARAEGKAHVTEQLRRKRNASVDTAFLAKVGPTPSEADLDHPIATLGGKTIRYRELRGVLASVPGGHGASAAREAFAWRAVDRILLEDEAVAKGLDRSPAVGRVLPGIERNILAGAAAERISGRADVATTDPKVAATLERLRAKAKLRIERAALDAAERELR